jgi:hypothetical protein
MANRKSVTLADGDAARADNGSRQRRGTRYPGCMKTQREKAEAKRQEKLDAVQEQVDSGSLTIRKMTAEERKKYPKPDKPRATRRRY